MSEDQELSLVMPFVVVTSVGGPFDDESFVAGWHCAQISEALSHSGTSWSGTVPRALVPQLDLIGMERGLVVTVSGRENDWAVVDLSPPSPRTEEEQ
jgi:hypothetical protein